MVSYIYSIVCGVGLATFNLSVVPKKAQFVISAILIALRVWLFAGSTASGLLQLISHMGYYPSLEGSLPQGMHDTVVALLVVHVAFGLVRYGVADTIHYNAHYLGVYLLSVLHGSTAISYALYQSLGAFDVVSLLYTISPEALKGFTVVLFAIVRVISYAILIHYSERGKGVLSLVLTCQLWILYLLIIQFASKNNKKKK